MAQNRDLFSNTQLRFPENIGSSQLTNRAIIFEAKEYESTLRTTTKTSEKEFSYKKQPQGSVALYVPSISEELNISWDSTESLIAKGVGVAKAIDVTGFTDILSAKKRKAVSQDTIATFQDVENRTFSLTFELVPSNERESETIRNIIDFFKYNALPEFDNAFVKYPHIFHITVLGVGNNDYFQFKPSSLTNVSVQHGDGEFMQVTTSNTPTVTRLTLSFRETTKMYRNNMTYNIQYKD